MTTNWNKTAPTTPTPLTDADIEFFDALEGRLRAAQTAPTTPPTAATAAATKWMAEKDASEAASLDDACDAVAGFLTGRYDTPTKPAPTPTPTTPTTPTTPPTLLETLVADFGVEIAFRVWAQRRTPTPCRPELWDAQRVLADAQEAERDAVANAKEARLVRRAAAADLAEARAAVAVQRARIARGRVG